MEGHLSHVINVRAENKNEHFINGEHFRTPHIDHS